jgi:dTMP kinase
MAGLLVAVEGPKSVGKTTLVVELERLLGDAASGWLFTKEPTARFDLEQEQTCRGLELAGRIASDREHHLAETIGPALREGRIVVSDRYILSSFVFHCLDDVDVRSVAELNATFPRPDLLVILQCPPDVLRTRRSAQESSTRLASKISAEDEVVSYIAFVRHCRPRRWNPLIGYNETMDDCLDIARQIVTTVETLRSQDG